MIVSQKTTPKNKLLRSFSEEDLYPMLKEMGNTQARIDKFQNKRIQQTIIVAIVFLLIGLFLSKWAYLGVPIGSYMFYKNKYKNIRSQYTTWKFQRQLQFSKFTRLLIPYLKQSKGNTSLYSIFNKILQRTENEQDRNTLYTLMSEMSSRPNEIRPFIEFAKKSSGSDMSILFMSTIFDFQQGTSDTSVIDELGIIASEELENGMDEIIAFKLRRFAFFPTKVVMSSFIIVIGFAAAVLIANLSQIDLNF